MSRTSVTIKVDIDRIVPDSSFGSMAGSGPAPDTVLTTEEIEVAYGVKLTGVQLGQVVQLAHVGRQIVRDNRLPVTIEVDFGAEPEPS